MDYITRGGISPQGKQKVCYIAHPNDFSVYFEMITSQILECHDCAVYFDSDLDNAENITDNIEIMQLIVLPVTSRFLNQPNAARDVVLKFAKEKHIPVLPILTEKGIESDFNSICGEVQCLSIVSKDPTELPYEEKLTVFLNSVLVGDELAAEIRAAFDAYVFLSYRKKDRQYAQQLMKLIHENDFCRDIAIWYDEFLVPGEDFNQAIKKALEKSSLFALVVTPNLVNEQNYVMSTEYPEAVRSNKHIFPVEMLSTDSRQLKKKYPDIPDCVSADDKKMFSDVLMQTVNHIAKMEKNDDPKHIFFIGLAYLNGIDVEKDTDKGVKLITSAADAGLIQAMEKLKSMYKNGIGVKMDYAKAIEIQEKLVDAYKSVFDKSGYMRDESDWLFSLIDLAGCLRDSGDLVRSAEIYKCTLEAIEHSEQTNIEQIFFRISNICYERLGQICSANNDLAGAQEYYKRIDELEMQYKEKMKENEYLNGRALSFKRRGTIYQELGDLANAVNSYMESIKFYNELLEKEEKESNLRGLAECYHNIAVIYRKQYNSDKSVEYYEKSCTIVEIIAKTSKDLSVQIDLAMIYANIAGIYMDKYDYKKASDYINKAYRISEPAKKYGTLELQRTLSYVVEKQGIIYHRQEKYALAKRAFRQNCDICENILKDSRIPDDYSALAGAQLWCGLSYGADGDLENSLKWCKMALYTAEHIPGVEATDAYNSLLSKCSYNVGITLHNQRINEQALEYFKKASEYIEPLCRKNRTPHDISQLTKANEMIASSYFLQGNYSEARMYIMSSIKMSEELLSSTNSLLIIDNLAPQYARYAEICRSAKEYTEAAFYFKKAIKFYEIMLKYTDNISDYEQLNSLWTLLASCCIELNQLNEAIGCYEKCLELLNIILQKDPDNKNKSRIDFCNYSITSLRNKLNK